MSFRIGTRDDLGTIFRIARHPAVKPTFGCGDEDDDWLMAKLGSTFQRFMYLIPDDNRAFFMLERMNDGGEDWSCHVAALPSARGYDLLQVGKGIKVWLKDSVGAERLWAWTTHDNRGARIFASWLGMKMSGNPGFCPWIYTDDEGVWMSVSLEECHVGR